MATKVQQSTARPRLRGGGPRLDLDEWLVLLDLFHRFPEQADPAFEEALAGVSRRLALKAAQRGAAREGSVLRSMAGLRRRMTVLRTLASGDRRRAPATALDVWDRYAGQSRECAAAVAALDRSDANAGETALAWTPEQEALSLQAYLKVRPREVLASDPIVAELQAVFRELDRLDRIVSDRALSWVAAGMNRFGAAERCKADADKAAAALWSDFLHDPANILAAAAAGRARALWTPGIKPPATPSHGPTPSIGDHLTMRRDGVHFVYVMLLCEQPGSRYWFKVGRSNDLDRRVAELNGGFPPGIGMSWTLIAHLSCRSAEEAHRAEQQALARLARDGYAIGREYFVMPLATALITLPIESATSEIDTAAVSSSRSGSP